MANIHAVPNVFANNGRVDTYLGGSLAIYNLFQESNRDNLKYSEEATRNIHSSTQLSNVFFSQMNLDVLQEAIRYLVYIKSCKRFIIDKQSDTELRLVMRGMYLQYAKNKQYDILAQIKELNLLVLDFCVPRIVQEIEIYHTYIRDIQQLPDPLDRGQFVSAKGTKVLQLKDF